MKEKIKIYLDNHSLQSLLNELKILGINPENFSSYFYIEHDDDDMYESKVVLSGEFDKNV